MIQSNRKLGNGFIAIMFFVGLLSLNTLGSLVYAAPTASDTSGVYDQNGNLNVGKCIKKGGIDFVTFLQANLWSDSFVESIVEPWNDVLVHNSCQGYDILGLVQQRDKLRKQIRDAFLTCRNDKIPQLKKAYYKTVVEIGFARNVVFGGPVEKGQLADMDLLLSSLEAKYVNKYHWFLANEFAVFKNELKLRYLDRRAAYVDECNKGSWAEVESKWIEFKKNVIDGEFIKEAGVELARKAQKVEQAVGNAKSWEDWAKGLAQVNLNGQACSATDKSGCGDFWNQFTGEFNKNDPFAKSNSSSTTQEAYETRKWSDFALRQATLKNEMTTRFQMLYGTASDSILKEFMNEAKNLDAEITASFKPLNDIKECSKTMNRRQCN
ncbi:MAG: hypothetical protein WCX95_01875 [Candidatus Gracilibacteria bacterium]